MARRTVRLVETGCVPTAVVAETTTWEAFPSRWPVLLDEVWAYVRRTGLPAGRNVMVYRGDRPTVEVEVGVEVERSFTSEGRVRPSRLPGGIAAMTVERGPPSVAGLAAAHAAVRAWSASEGRELEGTRWERYDHWRDDRDPADYETAVFWLISSSSAGS